MENRCVLPKVRPRRPIFLSAGISAEYDRFSGGVIDPPFVRLRET